ncbi:MAG: hypothetical protein UW71_C0037G0008 [Parcubacteria group bacterium GW2011_GWB1_44_7]|nr:MAG: hypothetical protein UW71_C0037G0008 [Parcubacteria group bacterium GW2011_GWB1_44_7]
MNNRITEKYFTQDDFSQREADVLAQVTAETGFVVEKEIFRGTIYDKGKVGSLIYKGTLDSKSAVLKLQGLKPEIDEGEIVRHFTDQNQSKLVRVPTLYTHKPWAEERGYGYLITEYLDAPKIFEMPFADAGQMRDFARFYQEYRTSALTRSWVEPETKKDSLVFTVRRVDHWRKISEHKKWLNLEDYAPYLVRYYPLAVKHLPSIPMVFCHGHLTANDIYRLPDGSFVVLSNLFWSYRPQWYDLAFNIWNCLMHIRDVSYTFEQLLKYVEEWLAAYRDIPVAKQDKDFERKMSILLLERTMGAILVDLGANDFYEQEENKSYFRHLLDLHQQLFNHLAEKIETV